MTGGGDIAYERSRELYEQARERMRGGALEEAAALFRASAGLHAHFETFEFLGECLNRLRRSQMRSCPSRPPPP